MEKQIEPIFTKDLNSIIETRQPLGMFYYQLGDTYVACDNRAGDAWVEEFDNKKDCFAWLKGEIEISDI